MSMQTFAGTQIDVDTEGFMTDPSRWTRDIALDIARRAGIELTDRHWAVLEFIRKDAQQNDGAAPNVRRLTKLGGVSTKELYGLFPGGPAKMAAKIAGYPKPHGCI